MARSGVVHLDGAERCRPSWRSTSLEDGVEVGRAIAVDRARARRLGVVALAEEEDDLGARRRAPARRRSGARRRGRGRRRRGRTRRSPRSQRRRLAERAVAAEELGAVAGPGGLPPAEVGEGDAAGRTRAFQALRASSAPVAASTLGHDERRGGAARRAEHPLDVGGHRQAPRPAGRGCSSVRREILTGSSAARTAAARARCRARRARSGCSPGRGGRRRCAASSRIGRAVGPQSCAALLVADVERLARRIADRVVRPGRQLVLPAVAAPRCSRRPTRRPGSRSRGWRSTLIQGAGVHCPAPSTVTYSRPSAAKPPRPLQNSRSGRAAAGGAAAPRPSAPAAGRRAAATAPALRRRARARASCSASVPWRPSSTARAAAEQGVACRRRQQVRPQDEDVPPLRSVAAARRRRDWLARTSAFEGGLQLLDVGARLLVQDHQVDGEPLDAPVLVRARGAGGRAPGPRARSMRTSTIGRSPEMPCAQSADGARRVAAQHVRGEPQRRVGE